jgi:hypothetical protein
VMKCLISTGSAHPLALSSGPWRRTGSLTSSFLAGTGGAQAQEWSCIEELTGWDTTLIEWNLLRTQSV